MMVSHGDVLRECMINLEIGRARRCWSEIAPDMPQPASDDEVYATLHHARTQSESIPVALRFWSHRWLLDHGLPSGLPDHLKPNAERSFPRIVEAVGVSVRAMSTASAPLAKAIELAMSDAVAECYADGKTSPSFIKDRMEEARRRIMVQ